MRRILCLASALVLIGGTASPAIAQMRAPGASVSGVVLNRLGNAAPGLTVQLFHRELGPSAPVITSQAGTYYFGYVPSNVGTPYTIEVRWGPNPIYRDYLHHLGEQPPIRLR